MIFLASTIQVEDHTMAMLKNLKLAYKTKTYDKAITRLMRKKLSGSMFGKLARGKKYAMSNVLRGLRDESDRP